MPRMSVRTMAAWGALGGALFALAGCGGGAKSPENCPDGTVLKGADCVPDDSSSSGDDSSSSKSSSSSSSGGDDSSGSSSSSSSSGSSSGGGSAGGSSSSSGSSGGGGDTSSSSGPVAYDKEAVEVQLKRAARQVKGHCGSASDEDGKRNGPWGQTKASVVLGRNGHVKQVTVPAPYDGKPVGVCVTHAFQKLIFPPYAAPSDAVIDWDIEIVEPKK